MDKVEYRTNIARSFVDLAMTDCRRYARQLARRHITNNEAKSRLEESLKELCEFHKKRDAFVDCSYRLQTTALSDKVTFRVLLTTLTHELKTQSFEFTVTGDEHGTQAHEATFHGN